MRNEKNQKFYLGIDIGTASVGYAVTDERYVPLKHRGENMLGTHMFEEASPAAKRRTFRISRRLTQRKSQRARLLEEIFAKEIAKTDERFFLRLKQSALYKEDKDASFDTADSLFSDIGYNDQTHHARFPTIHHLIDALMNTDGVYDVRLVYLACLYLVTHRGHFLSEVDKTNISDVLDFNVVYKELENCFSQNEISMPWDGSGELIGDVLKDSTKNISGKEKELHEILYDGKTPKTEDDYPYDKAAVIKLLCGGKTNTANLFRDKDYDKEDICLNKSDDLLGELFAKLDDEDSELLIKLKAVFDWSMLSGIVGDSTSISAAKVKVYDTHRKDLHALKDFIKNYIPGRYDEMFRISQKSINNYTSYSGNFKWVKKGEFKKSNRDDFLVYLKKTVENIDVLPEDEDFYADMMNRIDMKSFLPKQVTSDNRVIPYQLYYDELVKILDNASRYLPFLTETDEYGYAVRDKIISVFEFRIPYFVGPLEKSRSGGWVERRAEGKIYPWNFKEKVDYDKSEEAFIRRMTNTCTYLPGESVLPKNSLLYSKYVVLNEINNIKINNNPINVKTKQGIYELFLKYKTVTFKTIKNHLKAETIITDSDVISGIDEKVKSSFASYHAFKRLIIQGALTENDVESIINRMAFTEEKKRLCRWLGENYPALSDDDKKYIASLNLKGFGRLSKKLLADFSGKSRETGEMYNIIDALWETNENLMKLLSDRYTFAERIEEFTKEYYKENPRTLEDRLNELRIPSLVKRAVYRTLDVVDDIHKIKGEPTKIFIEMSRDFRKNGKGKRTKSRRESIKEFYKGYTKEETEELLKQLGGKTDDQLKYEWLYLYFMQLGKCMYTGNTIDINSQGDGTYNIDHIYPKCFVKDESLTNKVLVSSKVNGDKGNVLPISSDIRRKQAAFWNHLLNKNMISKAKYNRLTRTTDLTDEERLGFINRQLVETSQSTKAVALILKEMFPNTEIVYVKAGLVSEFRNEFELIKSRSINDLHHAKDAYLNIVAGNVYNTYFTRGNFDLHNYNLKVKEFFGHPKKLGAKTIWRGAEDIALVKKVMNNNHIHYTTYPHCQKGELFDVQLVKAGTNDRLTPKKKGLDPAKYGGYNKSAAAFFVLVKYESEAVKRNKTVSEKNVVLMPVELMYAERFINDAAFAYEYSAKTVQSIFGGTVRLVEFPLGKRIIKIHTTLLFDGFKAFIRGKSSGGKKISMSSMNSVYADSETERYIKHIDEFIRQKKENKNLTVSSEYHKITADENLRLYDFYLQKLSIKPFNLASCFKLQTSIMSDGRDKFIALSPEEQVQCLFNIIMLAKTGRAGVGDLSYIGGSVNACAFTISSDLSTLSKTYKDIRIIDTSASGVYEEQSENLCDLL